MRTAPALTIAGSDSGGGAGIQADLKTFWACGVYGASVVTAVTAIHAIPPALIRAQVDAVLSDIAVQAIKVGTVGTADAISAVAQSHADFRGFIVLDPVMIAKSGDALLHDEAVSAMLHHLAPLADLLTPNLPEAAKLLGTGETRNPEEVFAQGLALCARGAKAVLMKGGHATGPSCEDILVKPGGSAVFKAPRLNTRNTHGTGCHLPLPPNWPRASLSRKQWVRHFFAFTAQSPQPTGCGSAPDMDPFTIFTRCGHGLYRDWRRGRRTYHCHRTRRTGR
jgi:hydroxymethylpyrimidine/phosphomethylpyrimidine kinase